MPKCDMLLIPTLLSAMQANTAAVSGRHGSLFGDGDPGPSAPVLPRPAPAAVVDTGDAAPWLSRGSQMGQPAVAAESSGMAAGEQQGLSTCGGQGSDTWHLPLSGTTFSVVEDSVSRTDESADGA